ncbi:hypothetical protein [Thiolapillus sp.]
MKALLTIFMIFLAVAPMEGGIASETEYVVNIQPIVVRSDNGDTPAESAIPEALVERAYSRVPIDFILADPEYLDSTDARDGNISLDEILQLAEQEKLVQYNDGTLYMFFVNAMEGRKGPMGMGWQNGNIIFIALGDGLPPGFDGDIADMQAFVIAHEAGHNFNLRHAIDDPQVPDDVPNIQGDGPFRDRIDPRYSLNAYQVDIVRQSPLLHRKP